ncbi:nicotinate-nucleotide--dimethylbenzimidazole phosphoribosyltransferase [Caldimicrobium thiodismutans]|uniref:Nicotinate-nucleotide--dimethylbenzimidazole phosphoribosyltransferase n=1 Tax=Caldimicrobium thiodismutans TaxID=1653476 RepID=A0A0U4VZY9_9BACT|nr:nicotinate-nucleotide--dimethylbenzimidazole phosphoribosyltransferase [Caldimicrobium thiodismutans]BAU22491.1 nicotinate-nucleotide--dimethylbenzimidazole phosphoribosyltransferase [Caldimicrobium thiodismutans]
MAKEWPFQIKIEPLKEEWFKKAWERLDNLTKPKGSLGRLEELAAQMVAIFETPYPKINKKLSFVFAGDHGVTEEGVSAFPKEVTAQMIYNFLRGGAGINVLARFSGAEVKVVDVGVDCKFENIPELIDKKVCFGTRNFAKEQALTREEALRCIEVGYELAKEAISEGYNLIGIGDMGIGNTTPSSAITAVITGRPVEEVTGRGTGINDHFFQRKIEVIKKAIALHKPNPEDPIDVLSKVGGAEIGACAGVVLACAERRVPVVMDGFITGAGVLIAYKINPLVKNYVIASHRSMERGHQAQLEYMGLSPLLDLNLRLGEGTGAALAMLLIEASLKIYHEMATFDSAGVSKNLH